MIDTVGTASVSCIHEYCYLRIQCGQMITVQMSGQIGRAEVQKPFIGQHLRQSFLFKTLVSLVLRSRRNRVIRRATYLSSRRKSLSAPASNSIRQAKLALYLLKRVGARFPGPVIDQTLFGKIQILKIVQVLKDRLASVKSLGAPRRFRQPIETVFNVGR